MTMVESNVFDAEYSMYFHVRTYVIGVKVSFGSDSFILKGLGVFSFLIPPYAKMLQVPSSSLSQLLFSFILTKLIFKALFPLKLLTPSL